MSDSGINYKGYVLSPCSWQMKETGKWASLVGLNNPRSRCSTKYNCHCDFDTEEEANNFAEQFGKDIIDGKVSNCSTDEIDLIQGQ